MLRSKLSIAIVLFGWAIFFAYIFYDYREHGSFLLNHLSIYDDVSDAVFLALVFISPVGSMITGYLMNARHKLLHETEKTREMIKRASDEWRATFDSMPHGVMLTDGTFRIIRANNYVSQLAGTPIKEMVSKKRCHEVILGKDLQCQGCPLRTISAPGNGETIEHHDPDNGQYFLEKITPMTDQYGSTVSYIHSIIDIKETKEKEKQLVQSKDAFFNMLKDLDSTYRELKEIYNNLVVAFSNVIDAKSSWTSGHSVNVANYAVAIAQTMGLSEEEILILRTASLLHDIGKIGTYDKILDKKEKLTNEEFELIRKHPIQGENILRPIKGLEQVLPVIRHHHEKIDGTGYPDRLKGNEISLLARILCVADSYDSMVTSRPYRYAQGQEYAVLELKRCSGTQFDPEVVDAFLRYLGRKEELFVG